MFVCGSSSEDIVVKLQFGADLSDGDIRLTDRDIILTLKKRVILVFHPC